VLAHADPRLLQGVRRDRRVPDPARQLRVRALRAGARGARRPPRHQQRALPPRPPARAVLAQQVQAADADARARATRRRRRLGRAGAGGGAGRDGGGFGGGWEGGSFR